MGLIVDPREISINIYKEFAWTNYDVDSRVGAIKSLFPWLKIENKGALIGGTAGLRLTELAERFAGAKIVRGTNGDHHVARHTGVECRTPRDDGLMVDLEVEERQVFPAEVRFEERKISGENQSNALLYDGFKVASIYREMTGISSLKCLPVILTDRLIATDETDHRWHARVAVFSSPCVISATGIVEAPARSRAYYLKKQLARAALAGGAGGIYAGPVEDDEDHIFYEDPRIPSVIYSYLVQTVFYALTGNPICENPGCMLFNSHWQKELIAYQVNGKLCGGHTEMVKRWQEA